jgi:hypothetical protein
MAEEYNQYGEIKEKVKQNLSFDQKHIIHQTKDMFDSECSLCQPAMKKHVKTYWSDDE